MIKETTTFGRTKFACYTAYFTMSSIFCVPPLLFMTFRELYGISYTLLGTLILANFCTQLGVDLLFTLFAKHLNPRWIVRAMPLITSVGMVLYAVIPTLFPNIAYAGLLIGTVIFSVSAGLSEVLLSPVIAAIPSKNPQRDMSLLHSLYAFGVVTMVLLSTCFLKILGTDRWMFLMLLLAAFPLIPAVLFMISPMPDMSASASEGASRGSAGRRAMGLALCVGCIFFGSCAENVMGNWISGYMENALGLDKALGDVFGVAMFAVLLGVARISYAKFGKRIGRTLLLSMSGAFVCYLLVGFSSHVGVAFVACVATGFFAAMLWPGALMLMEEKIPHAGVAAYALMAAGGDLGASVAPQLMGIVIDRVSLTRFAVDMGSRLGLSPEQIGLKTGMIISALFPMIGTGVLLFALHYFKKHKTDGEA